MTAGKNETTETTHFVDMLDMSAHDRVKHELRILEGLMAQAVKDKDWTGALRVFEKACDKLQKTGKL